MRLEFEFSLFLKASESFDAVLFLSLFLQIDFIILALTYQAEGCRAGGT